MSGMLLAYTPNVDYRTQYGGLRRVAGSDARVRDPSISDRRILIVEDDPATLHALLELVPGWGYSVDSAGEGQRALMLIEESCPDVMLLDLNLPGGDGFSLLEALRGRGITVPTIVISARSTAADIARCSVLGAKHHLRKPVDPRHLRLLIAELYSQLEVARHRNLDTGN